MIFLPEGAGVVLGRAHADSQPQSPRLDNLGEPERCSLEPNIETAVRRKRKRNRVVGEDKLDEKNPGNARHRAIIELLAPKLSVFQEWWERSRNMRQPTENVPASKQLHATSPCLAASETPACSSHEQHQHNTSVRLGQSVSHQGGKPPPDQSNSQSNNVSEAQSGSSFHQQSLSPHGSPESDGRTNWTALHALKRVVRPKIRIPKSTGKDNYDVEECNLFNTLVSVGSSGDAELGHGEGGDCCQPNADSDSQAMIAPHPAKTECREVILPHDVCGCECGGVPVSSNTLVAEAHETRVELPCGSRFLLSHGVDSLGPLISGNKMQKSCNSLQGSFRLIIIDPPWENASVRRGAKYECLPCHHLLRLPVPQLLDQETGLVALWMTNRERLMRFVENELIPAWGLELVSTWYWIKVCPADGATTIPLSCMHRHPYEPILLLRPRRSIPGSPEVQESGTAASSHQVDVFTEGTTNDMFREQKPLDVTVEQHSSSKCEGDVSIMGQSLQGCVKSDLQEPHDRQRPAKHLSTFGEGSLLLVGPNNSWNSIACLPQHFCIFSSPKEHSRKPNLGQLLRAFLPFLREHKQECNAVSEGAQGHLAHAEMCLELFAREVAPGFTCWGNEVLKFNEIMPDAGVEPNTSKN